MRRRLLSLEDIAREDGRYPAEALAFVSEALHFTQKMLGREPRKGRKLRDCHVTGRELCEGIRRFALQEFGYMAKTVFEKWGIRSTRDFGEIVYLLIRYGLMSKTESDSIDDFNDVYDFSEAFDHPFEITLHKPDSASSPEVS